MYFWSVNFFRRTIHFFLCSEYSSLVPFLNETWDLPIGGAELAYSRGHLTLNTEGDTIFPPLLYALVSYSGFAGCQIEYTLANVAVTYYEFRCSNLQ